MNSFGLTACKLRENGNVKGVFKAFVMRADYAWIYALKIETNNLIWN